MYMNSQLSIFKVAGYFILVSTVISMVLMVTLNIFKTDEVISADFYVLVIAPYLSSLILKRRLNLPLSENEAEKIANIYIIFYFVFFYLAIFLYLNSLSSIDIEKLSEHTIFILVAFLIMSLAIYILGKWFVVMNLTKTK